MEKNEIISELYDIALLKRREAQVGSKLDVIEGEKEAAEKAAITAASDKLSAYQKKREKKLAPLPTRPGAVDTVCPVPPQKPNVKNPFLNIILGVASELLAVLGLVLWVIAIITGSENYGFVFFSIFLMLGGIAFWFVKGRRYIDGIIEWHDNKQTFEKNRTAWIKRMEENGSESKDAAWIGEWKAYEQSFGAFVADCNGFYRETLDEVISGKAEIAKQALAKLEAVEAELNEITEALAQKTVIHSDLHPLAGEIARMLEMGRADSLKEAINLALTEQEAREQEAARRAAEERRAEMLAEEERRHNEAMEQEAREAAIAERQYQERMAREARAQTAAAERQAAAAAREARAAENAARDAKWRAEQQARDARREEHRAHTAAMHRCSSCVNSAKCSGSVKNNPNCAAYKPR